MAVYEGNYSRLGWVFMFDVFCDGVLWFLELGSKFHTRSTQSPRVSGWDGVLACL